MRTIEQIECLIRNIKDWTDEDKADGKYLIEIKHLEIELKNTMAYHKGFGVNRDEITVEQVKEKLEWYRNKIDLSFKLMEDAFDGWEIPEIWISESTRLHAELKLMEYEFKSIAQKD